MGNGTFHKGKYYVSFKGNISDFKKDITICIIKVFENDSLQISLSDEEDPCFLCVLNVTRSDYDDLKKQQGLLIDFDNFPSQLVRLLQQCASNNMFLILQQSNPLQYYFEIVEHNEFRRLVHLSLKTTPATDTDIKKHMSNTIIHLKNSLSTLKNSASNTEHLFNDKCNNLEHKVCELNLILTKMEEEKLRREADFQESIRREQDRLSQERLEWQKANDMLTQTQSLTMREALSRKEKEIEDLNMQCRMLHDKVSYLENKLSDKSTQVSLLEQDIHSAHIDVATTKAKIATLEKDILEKDNLLHHLRTKCNDYEKALSERMDQSKELNNKILTLEKEKNYLEERMALSKSLADKNNEAAVSTSEQLLKANQIITKQNADLMEMKEKLLCRTAIALEQEKVIERNSKEIDDLHSELSQCTSALANLNVELDNLKKKTETTEKSLKDKEETIKNNNMVIQWLHKKMEENSAPSQKDKVGHRLVSRSTPYMSSNNNELSNEDSTDLPDFYASSRITPEKMLEVRCGRGQRSAHKHRSDIEESPKTEVISRNGRVGLDPKYLQPSIEGNTRKAGAHSSKSTADSPSNKGKENKNMNLPQVDYREKKTSRTNTYRATPVSAYFP